MDRRKQLLYAATAAVILVLLIVCILNYQALQSATGEIGQYQKQQKEMASAIRGDYLQDMQAGRLAWIQAHPDEYRELNNQGITIEADFVETQYYSAVLDPANPDYVVLGPAGDVEAGQVKIGLGQYYDGNYSSASGWSGTYLINRSTHAVAGSGPGLIQDTAYRYYQTDVAPSVFTYLGVARDAVTGSDSAHIDTSYVADTGNWVDVTEYRYGLKNTAVTPYLLVKIFVNGTSGEVVGTDVSRPYYTSQAPVTGYLTELAKTRIG